MKLYTIKSDIAGSNGRTMRVNVVYNTEQIERNKELITGIPLQKNWATNQKKWLVNAENVGTFVSTSESIETGEFSRKDSR